MIRPGEAGGLGLDDDAGDVVGHDVVEFPGEFEALFAPQGFEGRFAAVVEVAQPHPDPGRAGPDRRAEQGEQRTRVEGAPACELSAAATTTVPTAVMSTAWRAGSQRACAAASTTKPMSGAICSCPGGTLHSEEITAARAKAARPVPTAHARLRARSRATAQTTIPNAAP
jgi:hypothetical protein